MLTALTTGLRFKLAVGLATFAALCFVAPPAVLAFGHGANTIKCLSHADVVNHGNPNSHGAKHHENTAPEVDHKLKHQDHTAPTGVHKMGCCGLFCMSALIGDCGAIEPIAVASTRCPAQELNFISRVAERLDRPPISLSIV